MKMKTLASILGVAMLFGSSLFAQDQPTRDHARREFRGQRFDPMMRVAKALQLTDEQKTKMHELRQEQHKQRLALHEDTSLSREAKREKMQQMRQDHEAKFSEILTAEQQSKLKDLRAKQHERMGTEGMGRGHGRRPERQ
jgi:Spy/CpxP family protein refolding chaperone